MGGRGSFLDVSSGNFAFRDGGQTFITKSTIGDVKIIEKNTIDSVGAPLFSHSPSSTYAVIQNGELKYITFYDETHKQVRSIDLLHSHKGKQPHVHLNLDHSGPGYDTTPEDNSLIEKIRKEGNYR